MKKICYVVTIPLTIKSFFIPQLKYLAENGIAVSVICTDDGNIKNELGTNINYIPLNIPRGISFRQSFRVIIELKRIFLKEQFDLIQYSTPNAAFYASIAARIARCKIRNYHLMGFRYVGASGIKSKILKVFEKITCNNSTDIECVSDSNKKFGIKEKLFLPGKATVVWNGSSGGVDIERFNYDKRKIWRKQIRSELGYGEEDFVYGFVGRITRDKGINELLEAFFRMDNNSKLLLIGPFEGENTLNQELLKKAKNNESILFHSSVREIEKYYAAIDVLVLPSYREGFGNVVIEAGAVGTPAIVSNIPGPIDAIDNNNTALTVKVCDSEDLMKKMQKIKEINYKLMGENAEKYSREKFDSRVLSRKIYERKMYLLKRIEL